MRTITKRLEFDAAHRVLGHEGKCRHLHGHRYAAEITVTAPELDSLGRVIDFSVIKAVVGKWIDDNWDHNIILHKQDPLLVNMFHKGQHSDFKREWHHPSVKEIFGGRFPFILAKNPTAEIMARYLHDKASHLLMDHKITVTNVRLYETPTSWSDSNTVEVTKKTATPVSETAFMKEAMSNHPNGKHVHVMKIHDPESFQEFLKILGEQN